MRVVLYSTDCPVCVMLKEKLKQHNIDFTENKDTEIMLQKGITAVPVLEVNGELYNARKALEWVNNAN